jgi:hypothetical protein
MQQEPGPMVRWYKCYKYILALSKLRYTCLLLFSERTIPYQAKRTKSPRRTLEKYPNSRVTGTVREESLASSAMK